MATLDDLDREVRRLRKRVNELEGVGREQGEVSELIGDGVGAERRGFSAAVAKSNAQALADTEQDAINYLKRSGDSLKKPAALQAFRSRFGGLNGLGASRLDEIINQYCEP